MSFAAMPLDVILELTFFMDLQDSIHLLATCSLFASLKSTKDFWYKTLDRMVTVHRQPLPCPVGVDITVLPIEGLQKLAIHAYVLKKNWTSDLAFPVSVRTFALGEEYRDIYAIPGTHLVVTNSGDRLSCWHTTSGALVGSIEHEDGDSAFEICSPPFNLPGKCFVGLASQGRAGLGLLVARIVYGETGFAVSKVYSNFIAITNILPSLKSVALDDKLIGAIYTSRSDLSSVLVYGDLHGSVMHHVPLGALLGSDAVCILYGGHFYIQVGDRREQSSIICVPASPSDSQVHERIPITTPFSIPARQLKSIYTCRGQCIVPTYGVFSVTRRTSQILTEGSTDHLRSVHFWPAETVGSRLQFGELSFYEHPFEITHLVAGISGRYAAIIDIDYQTRSPGSLKPKIGLGLVRYAAEPTPHTTFHRLGTSFVDVNFYTAVIALDDALGVVYISHIAKGEATTIAPTGASVPWIGWTASLAW
ncbi:hypothetical protein C8R44DRAFT_846188 [Mycena epipterygia]|nr:hypothetical protein C8R44DRAFT_846188 [Mycena epipterygia]